MGEIRVSHFLVYMLTCMVDGVRKTYIGMTGVLEGQSDDAALLVRRRFHVSCQKTWLQGMSVSTLRLRRLLSNLSEADAQVEEARHTAQLLNSVEDFGTIREGRGAGRCGLTMTGWRSRRCEDVNLDPRLEA
jgi:hypothetical protein